MSLSQHKQQALSNPWAWGLMLTFVIFVGANIGFIYLAFSHSGQVVPDHAFHDMPKKQHHNNGAQPWKMALSLPTLYHQTQHEISVSITSNETNNDEMSVTIHAYRPSEQQADFKKVLTPHQGQYQAQLTFPLVGQWDLEIEAKQGQQRQRLMRRVYVHPKAS